MDLLFPHKHLIFIIFQKLDDHSLGRFARTNKYINSLYKDKHFWLNRIHIKFDRYFLDIELISLTLKTNNYLNTYQYIKKEETALDNLLHDIPLGVVDNNWTQFYSRASEIVQSIDYSYSYFLDPIISKIIKFAKGKSAADRQRIYRTFGFTWRIVKFSKKYKDSNFMDLTK